MNNPLERGASQNKNWHAEIIQLATKNPEAAAEQLFDLLGTQTKHGEELVVALDRNNCFPDRVQVTTTTWHSGTTVERDRVRILQVGLQTLTDRERKVFLFDESTFSPEAEIAYRFSHELSHHLIEELAEKNADTKELLELTREKIKSARKAGTGFSTLGSLRVYAEQGVDMQVIEDMVELCNMYIRSPDYLRRFLSFLSSEPHKPLRDQLKLATFKDKDGAKLIYDLIETLVTACLQI